MILLQGAMALPIVLPVLFLGLSISIAVILLIYNLIAKAKWKERAYIIPLRWSFLITAILIFFGSSFLLTHTSTNHPNASSTTPSPSSTSPADTDHYPSAALLTAHQSYCAYTAYPATADTARSHRLPSCG
jgi:hypothetical protein